VHAKAIAFVTTQNVKKDRGLLDQYSAAKLSDSDILQLMVIGRQYFRIGRPYLICIF
jgi:hypothetical protein